MVERATKMEGEVKGKVCVTGGTGYVASWLIKSLLHRGYTVTTTIRPDPELKRDISFLTNLPGAEEKLEIFQADLDDPESFFPAIEGCTGVFHLATPVDFKDKETEEIVTQRSINGTLGILRICRDSKTAKRFVYTSSASAVMMNSSGDEVMDESFWSDMEFIRSSGGELFGASSYSISKTLTEKAVMEYCEKNGLVAVAVIPPFIVGPFVCNKFPGSVRTALALVLGNKEEYGFFLNASIVHVEDVARAHIFLFEHPNLKGRYICSSHSTSLEEMAEFFSSRYPQYPLPSKESLKEIKGHKHPTMSSKKLLDCGFQFEFGIEEMFNEAIQCCQENGYL